MSVLRLYTSHELRERKSLAPLHVLWQPKQVYAGQADSACRAPHGIHTFGKFQRAHPGRGCTDIGDEKMPDRIQDFYTDQYQESATVEVLKFLRRELIQQILLLLFDDDFMYTYVHGDVVECGDGITRRQFPRFVLHTADFMEK